MFCRQLLQEGFGNLVIGGICSTYYRLTLVEIIPYPMCEWHNPSRFANADAYELTFLRLLLSQSVNLCTAYGVGQWRYDNRIGLLRHGLPLLSGLCRWPGLSLCRLLFFSPCLEFLFKILTAEKRVKFLIPEFMPANSIIKVDAP